MPFRPLRSILASAMFFTLTACSGYTATTPHQPVPPAKVDAPLAQAKASKKPYSPADAFGVRRLCLSA